MKDKLNAKEYQDMVKKGTLLPPSGGREIIRRKSRYNPDRISNLSDPPGRLKKKSGTKVSGRTRSGGCYDAMKPIPDLFNYSKAWFNKGGIYIPFEVISKKNSKRVFPFINANGKPSFNVLPSTAFNRYMSYTFEYYNKGKKVFLKIIEKNGLERPYHVGLYFIRKTKSKSWDFQNMGHGPLDLMESHKWITFDSVENIHTTYLGYEYDPEHPGIVIFLLPPKMMKPLLDIPKMGVNW